MCKDLKCWIDMLQDFLETALIIYSLIIYSFTQWERIITILPKNKFLEKIASLWYKAASETRQTLKYFFPIQF